MDFDLDRRPARARRQAIRELCAAARFPIEPRAGAGRRAAASTATSWARARRGRRVLAAPARGRGRRRARAWPRRCSSSRSSAGRSCPARSSATHLAAGLVEGAARAGRGVVDAGDGRRSLEHPSVRRRACSCVDGDGLSAVDAGDADARAGAAAARSADAAARRSTTCRRASRSAGPRTRRDRGGRARVLTAALLLGHRRRRTDARRRPTPRSASSSAGRSASFQAVKHLLRRHARARRGRPRRGLRGRRCTSTTRGRRRRPRGRARAKLLAGEAALANGKAAHPGARRHGLHLGGRRSPLPEARLGPGPGLRHRRRARPGARRRL